MHGGSTVAVGFCCLYKRGGTSARALGRVGVPMSFGCVLCLLLLIVNYYPPVTKRTTANRGPVLVVYSCGPKTCPASTGMSSFVSRCRELKNGQKIIVRGVGYGDFSSFPH